MTLDPALLARLGPLQVRARKVMEGVLTGLHKSPHHGQSVEFAEHKEYAPGDEIKYIDWRAFAKLDKYYVKRFEMETNLRALLVVDASGSMAYGRGAMTKLQYAAVCAGALAYLLSRQGDQACATSCRLPHRRPTCRSCSGCWKARRDAARRCCPRPSTTRRKRRGAGPW
jgi:uncharacterized protein (DUF58 family)